MSMLLFLITSLLWGCGALATTMQTGVTPAAWSVSLRMSLAGLVLLTYGKTRRATIKLNFRNVLFVGLQGVLFFAVAFIAFYEATQRMPSGLAALVLATSSPFAAVFGWIVLGDKISRGLIAGTVLGFAGIAMIFLPGFSLSSHSTLVAGFAWALLASLATAAGTVMGARNQRAGISTFAILGWAALIGGTTSAGWALSTGEPLVFDLTLRYVASLAYLALGASCLTFLLYFDLVNRQGSGRAAYVFNTVPIIALILSSLFEGLQLDINILVGSLAIIVGNVIVLKK